MNSNKLNFKIVLSWLASIIAAVIMLQTLFFKFTGAEESIYIFSALGIEPWGRFGSGFSELFASILILIPRFRWFGALMGLGIMSGAIASHILVLGISVQNDGGLLFFYACAVFVSCAFVLWIEKRDFLLKRLKS